MKAYLSILCSLLIWSEAAGAPAENWRSLFDGDLSGWETWLGRPHKSVVIEGLARNEPDGYTEPVGLNRDPRGVFTVVERDGAKAIRASGEIFGTLISREEFENYHLTLEYQWGEKKWEPRLKTPRDAGVLYHSVGPYGGSKKMGPWMRSHECQIQENDTGDYWSVDGGISDVAAVKQPATGLFAFAPGSDRQTFGKIPPGEEKSRNRCVRSEMKEKPNGQWNRVELLVVGDRALHIVNGTVVMALQNSRQPGENGADQPLTRGKIQLQSEGAEVFYRAIRIKPLAEIPAEYLRYFESKKSD
jgi:hypothetical protein